MRAYSVPCPDAGCRAVEFEILPAQADTFAESGLSYPTKFDLGKTFELDYNDIWFGVPPQAPYGQNPKLGILHPSLFRRAMAAHTAATQRNALETVR